MNNPSTTVELADAIESLIASYMDGVHEAAQQAVERGLVRSTARSRPSRQRAKGTQARPVSGTARRTAAELDEVCDALCEAVRSHPGTSMAELAEQMGGEARTLQRPMAKLKSAGRVRSVGQRHLTRYYPAVVRAGAEQR